jgi:hypothetical protein
VALGVVHPLEFVLIDVKNNLSENFCKKWSQHKHTDEKCNTTVTMDGSWKTCREKCAYDEVYFNSKEFGPIKIGCTQTPARQSYYCKKHAAHELTFNVDGKLTHIRHNDIKTSKIGFLIFLKCSLSTYLFY